MIEILRSRRSIRKYEKRPIDERSLETLKEALLRCPSSRGINPWTFIFVDEVDLLAGLSKAKEHGSGFLKNAALAIVVCGDESESDVWVEDCSIAAIVAHLTAHSLGLGSCWIQIRNRAHSTEKTAEQSCPGTSRPPFEPEGGVDHQYRFPRRDQDAGSGGKTPV